MALHTFTTLPSHHLHHFQNLLIFPDGISFHQTLTPLPYRLTSTLLPVREVAYSESSREWNPTAFILWPLAYRTKHSVFCIHPRHRRGQSSVTLRPGWIHTQSARQTASRFQGSVDANSFLRFGSRDQCCGVHGSRHLSLQKPSTPLSKLHPTMISCSISKSRLEFSKRPR